MFSKTKKIKHRSSGEASTADNLPAGAEAALWSIIEVIPDPRNHLALTKDPTAEVRLTRAAIDEAVALASTAEPQEPTAEPAPRASWLPAELPPVPEPEPAWPTRRVSGVRWSADTAEVRLPSLTAPQTASPMPAAGDASVHPIDPPVAAPAVELPVQRRYARGA